MNNNIRAARATDAVSIAPLLQQAMGSLADRFTNNAPAAEQLSLFEHFIGQPGNQYSFENTLVYQTPVGILGMSNSYDGGKLYQLRASFFDYISKRFGVQLNNPDDETEAGEFYLDCVSVDAAAQGQGIGTALLQAMIHRGKVLGHSRAGLLVDIVNPQAKKLYLKLGFEVVKEKSFMGGSYVHMQHVYKG